MAHPHWHRSRGGQKVSTPASCWQQKVDGDKKINDDFDFDASVDGT